jgi:hypothetical protein
MRTEQLEQISKGFKFWFEDDEVEVTSVSDCQMIEHSEVRLCKTETYEIVGPFKLSFIAQYLEQTNQEDLLDMDIISAGLNIVEKLDLKKIKLGKHSGKYSTSSIHYTHKGGTKPLSLIDLGLIAVDSVLNKKYTEWFSTLEKFKKIRNGH